MPAVSGYRPTPPFTATTGRAVRVLLVTDKLGYEQAKLHGVGRLVVEWTRGFHPARVAVVACALRDPGGLRNDFRRDGTPITFLRHGRFNPIAIWSLIRLIRRHRIDVLHLQEFGASTLGRIAGLLTGTPTIVHVQYAYSAQSYPWYVQLLDRLLAPTTARAITVFGPGREFCVRKIGFRPEQVEVIPNPLPRGAAAPAPPRDVERLRKQYDLHCDTPVVGALTRFFPVKGLPFLIDAFALVLREVPRARLLLIGDGPGRKDLEQQVHALGISERVIFTGFRQDVEAHLGLLWVTVFSSLHEGMPLAAIESLAAGVPMVASRVGGLPEVVSDGKTGFLVAPGAPAEIAEAVLRIFRDAGLRARMSAACRVESRRFSMDAFTESMERVYREVAAASSR